MAVHIITTPSESGDVKVGNAMSTSAYYDAESSTMAIQWKRGEPLLLTARPGDRVRVEPGFDGVVALVMQPPRNAIAALAWRYNFFSAKRRETLALLEEEARGMEFYDSPRGCMMPAAMVVKGDHCAVVYEAAMGGWVGKPRLWWTATDCTAGELEDVIKRALSTSALHYYT